MHRRQRGTLLAQRAKPGNTPGGNSKTPIRSRPEGAPCLLPEHLDIAGARSLSRLDHVEFDALAGAQLLHAALDFHGMREKRGTAAVRRDEAEALRNVVEPDDACSHFNLHGF